MRLGEHRFDLHLEWTPEAGADPTGARPGARSARRAHLVNAPGKLHPVEGSAARAFHGDPERWNPEELLLAALADCHLLSYLYVAAKHGVVVRAYTDEPTAVLHEDGRGGGSIVEAVLRPRVTVAEASMTGLAMELHREASELCFIAASVAFPVRHEPTVDVLGD
ncbi:OsmC family protein [Agromyces larvae]|uniref:OsmC family protein n=1 Tax=Agromyces larvae TaxID=2929802 RepID=A0ABY4BZG4_9MICO|nr:OsmC family protein [Agromyces larvae]UOE44633.1 OsmC family protein [Agromyces larvae]